MFKFLDSFFIFLQEADNMRLGIMTGGGDAPGLNGIIEAASKALLGMGHQVWGIYDGFEGIFENRLEELTVKRVSGIHAFAGTILGTSNKCGTEGREAEFLKKYQQLQLDGLIVAGGDGTFKCLSSFNGSIPLIGVPKTIDNDLSGTDVTFGYDTACAVVAEAVDALRTTANSHKRTIFVETMGRSAGWIALGGGMAGYADAILIPECPFDLEELRKYIWEKRVNGKRGIIIAVAEGAHPKGESVKVAFTVSGSPESDRLGGIGEYLARWCDAAMEGESRHVVLGHLQRAKSPTTADKFLTLAMGAKVGELVRESRWGQAVAFKAGQVTAVPIEEFMGGSRLIPLDHPWLQMARSVGIFV
ncbi:MAG TPA: ATP-dependent 6-phosphofructokinase [Patescibacteria group bacterium]|nr:ATP-dependent 6-phosphofructokinase [Patescibacteria group bacterium]